MSNDGPLGEAIPSREIAEEFTDLLAANHGRIFGAIYSLVLNRADAEDLYQQTALVLWKKFDQFELGSDFGSWALRVARLTVYNFIRTKGRSRVFFSEPMLETILESQEAKGPQAILARSAALQKCLQKLNPDDLRLVSRCYEDQSKIKEVAADEGRSTNALYLALHRIRKALFRCIEYRLKMELE